MSNIEWTDATWNPVVGCTKVSEGCRHCYAMTMAKRLAAMAEADHQAGRNPGRKAHYTQVVPYRDGKPVAQWNNNVELVEEALADPLGWRKPRRVFVNSMSDLFHESVPFDYVDRVFAVMALSPRHTFQILTKRPERAAEYFEDDKARREAVCTAICEGWPYYRGCEDQHRAWHVRSGAVWPLPNVWLGTSVEGRGQLERIMALSECPAAVQFVSFEPLLEDVGQIRGYLEQLRNPWIIVGGESGPGARPCDVRWIRSIVQQCQAAGVPAFVKQLGAKPYTEVAQGEHGHDDLLDIPIPAESGDYTLNLRDSKGGDWDEWPADLRVREFPQVEGVTRA